MIKIYKREETHVSYKQIVDLIHESFQERLDQGLRYTCSFITEDEFKNKTKCGIVLVAIDEGSKEIVGTATLNMHHDKKKRKYGYLEYVAVKPQYKHQHIGTRLLNERQNAAVDLGCKYLMSDTSTKAETAVKYHLKNGFKIIGLESYASTNYWSYIFRKELQPNGLWNNSLFVNIHFLISYVFIMTTKNKDGSLTFMGRIYKKIRQLCR